MKPESDNIKDYLRHDSVIDWCDSAVKGKAADITDGLADEVDKARMIYEWVRDTIPHSNDINAQVLTCSATDVLNNKTGMCFAKSHLLAALLRSVNIPTGFCYQTLMYDPPMDKRLVLHGLNGVYLSSAQKWIIIDARGNTQDINAQFSLDTPKLAFPMDNSMGEYLYKTIFVSPFKHVVERLRKYENRMEFCTDLPQPV